MFYPKNSVPFRAHTLNLNLSVGDCAETHKIIRPNVIRIHDFANIKIHKQNKKNSQIIPYRKFVISEDRRILLKASTYRHRFYTHQTFENMRNTLTVEKYEMCSCATLAAFNNCFNADTHRLICEFQKSIKKMTSEDICIIDLEIVVSFPSNERRTI